MDRLIQSRNLSVTLGTENAGLCTVAFLKLNFRLFFGDAQPAARICVIIQLQLLGWSFNKKDKEELRRRRDFKQEDMKKKMKESVVLMAKIIIIIFY